MRADASPAQRLLGLSMRTLALPLLLCTAIMGPCHAANFLFGIAGSVRDPGFFTATSWIGANAIRLDAPWSDFEKQRGIYAAPAWVERTVTEARARNIEPVLILAYGNALYTSDKPLTQAHREAFARYAAWVATHYRGKVRYYDLWNEWDTHTGRTQPGSPEDYVAFARVVYAAIKRADPQAIVLSGGISDSALTSPWFDRFLEARGLQYIDALSIHPYNWNWRNDRSPRAAISLVDDIHRKAVATVNRSVDVYITEMGYPTHLGRFGLTDDAAACRVMQFYSLARERAYIKGVWWYGIRDNGLDPARKEDRFGLFSYTMQPKAAARAFRDMTSTSQKDGTETLRSLAANCDSE